MGRRKGMSSVLKTRFMVNDAYREMDKRRPYICPFCGGRIVYRSRGRVPVYGDGGVLYYMVRYRARCSNGCFDVEVEVKDVAGESSWERAYRLYTALIDKLEGDE